MEEVNSHSDVSSNYRQTPESKMKLFSLTIFFLFLMTSCERFCDSYIENATGSDIIMIAKLDTNITRHYAVSNIEFLNSFANDSTSLLLRIDTSNLIGVYMLKNNGVIQLDGGLGDHPTSKFSYLQIRTKTDTIAYYSNLEIKKAFRQDSKPDDTLTIQ